ncbi:hypothetical protein [Micromonospora globispora]|uniref:hypothetical protein n=1 Tax=Micromonospora globispora TaxID=1450148 RepID=UPI000F514981|nr:hypothetical protein [Micromonospora globispora]
MVDELGLPELPDDDHAAWEVVVSYAPRLLSGVIAPVHGAHAIAAYAGALGFPEPLATFAFLAELWVTIGSDSTGRARPSVDHASSPEPTEQQVSAL